MTHKSKSNPSTGLITPKIYGFQTQRFKPPAPHLSTSTFRNISIRRYPLRRLGQNESHAKSASRPFGLNITALSSTAPLSKPNDFKYNSFEFEESFDLGWYDYQARQYDPQLGRFLSVDPAADLMRRHGVYNYAFDNPIRFIDPDGMMPEESTSGEQATGGECGGPGEPPCEETQVSGEDAANAVATDLLQIKHSLYNVFLNIFNSDYRATFVRNEDGEWETGFVFSGLGYLPSTQKNVEAFSDVLNVYTAGVSSKTGLLAKTPAAGATDEVLDATLQLAQNKEAGTAAENALNELFGGTQQAFFNTSKGRRFVDNLTDNGIAQESKVGRVSFSRRIRKQLSKDLEILSDPTNNVRRIEWHFAPGKTGSGASQRLKNALKEGGAFYIEKK